MLNFIAIGNRKWVESNKTSAFPNLMIPLEVNLTNYFRYILLEPLLRYTLSNKENNIDISLQMSDKSRNMHTFKKNSLFENLLLFLFG